MVSKKLAAELYQLSKPGIIYGNMLTVVAGYLYGVLPSFSILRFSGLVVGLSLVIAGACAANNILDRKLDIAMQRTKRRALVTGQLPISTARLYAAVTTILGLVLIMTTQYILIFWLASTAWLAYVALYGYAKRQTVHGTLVGCISGSLPLVIGYCATTGRLDSTAALLFLLMTCWQMAHFYGIALYRQIDYAAAKVPVMPVVHGVSATRQQTVFYMVCYILVVATLGITGRLQSTISILLLVVAMSWLVTAITGWNRVSSQLWGRQVFLRSLLVMFVMSLLLAIDPLL